MLCPHCSTSVRFSWSEIGPINSNNCENGTGYFIFYDNCPNCENSVIYYNLCNYAFSHNDFANDDLITTGIIDQKILYPNRGMISNIESIPNKYLDDYEEALKVLSASPKASAALSRRLLQIILNDEYNIKKNNLSKEIESFISLEGIPSHLSEAVDAIRHIGNFAAHPYKNTNTGEVLPVEMGEAEWLIEILEALFDFTFVQPIKLKHRKDELNKKLLSAGRRGLQ